ncbi:MAG TPA: hypothetical protein VFH74_01220 [Gaiellales bacterium]|nr:hypothetical protein [Gaiellales bacterium]
MTSVVVAVVAAVMLVGVYALAGGTDYAPAATPDPCKPRQWPHTSGLSQIETQVAVSALGGAACTLGVSREELTIAFADQSRLNAFARKHGFTKSRIDDAARAGLNRAIDDGEHSGAINGVEAFLLRAAVAAAPIDKLIGYVRQSLS